MTYSSYIPGDNLLVFRFLPQHHPLNIKPFLAQPYLFLFSHYTLVIMRLGVFHLLGAVVVGLSFVQVGSTEYTDAPESNTAKFRRALERRL